MPPSKSSVYQRSSMVLIFVTLLLAGIVIKQNDDLQILVAQSNWRPEIQRDHVAETFEIIDSAMPSTMSVRLNHECKGEVRYVAPVVGGGLGNEESLVYCVGTNRLVAVDATGSDVVLDSRVSMSINDAPVLLGVERIPGSFTVLATFMAVPCTFSTDDCGVGAGLVGANIAYNSLAHTVRSLKNYPSVGTPVWNNAGTKAVFPVMQIGGAGCDDRAIVGYDLENDIAKNVTTEVACEFDFGNATDVEGNPLPEWGPIFWSSNNVFIAALLQTDGTWDEVEGEF